MLIQINRNTHLIGSVSLENPNTLSLSLTQGILSGNSHLCSISSFSPHLHSNMLSFLLNKYLKIKNLPLTECPPPATAPFLWFPLQQYFLKGLSVVIAFNFILPTSIKPPPNRLLALLLHRNVSCWDQQWSPHLTNSGAISWSSSYLNCQQHLHSLSVLLLWHIFFTWTPRSQGFPLPH